ncbi:MAG: glutamine--fructose-6-phosphate transaminase (isomerizing), partial [Mariprofundaceae bacterium]|nr:glutamine--fructose-6-phosphate transaminase (isomerizing) [Mariprofundaceae bacterium]
MCGIIGAVAQRDVVGILVNGLEQLEYRGYDSAGIAAIEGDQMQRVRAMGKLVQLKRTLEKEACSGKIGIGHTRWATHGVPAVHNAHPHHCGEFTLVHNGIMENHAAYRKLQDHHHFESETDSEVIVHLLSDESKSESDFFSLVRKVVGKLEGSYALAVIRSSEPNEMIVARHGSPLVIGLGIGENFIASDVLALLSVTSRFIYLEEGDVAKISTDKIVIVDAQGEIVDRPIKESSLKASSSSRGAFRHFMLKEIFEQPTVISDALEGRLLDNTVLEASLLGEHAQEMLGSVKRVQIAACGTSYHSGLTAKYWFEKWAGIPCDVDIASELRYRKPVIIENTFLVVISQSGETADTLAVLLAAKDFAYAYSLAICNVPES